MPLHTEPVLGQLATHPGRARAAFRDFVRHATGVGHRADLYAVLEQRVLGTEAFAETVLGRAGPEAGAAVRATVEEILEAVAAAWKVDPEAMRAWGRTRRAAQARAAAAYLAREIAGRSLTAVARAVGRDVASLSHGVRRLEAAHAGDPALTRRLRRVATVLRAGPSR